MCTARSEKKRSTRGSFEGQNHIGAMPWTVTPGLPLDFNRGAKRAHHRPAAAHSDLLTLRARNDQRPARAAESATLSLRALEESTVGASRP